MHRHTFTGTFLNVISCCCSKTTNLNQSQISCRGGAGCGALICGLHLFYKADNSDNVRLEELKRSIGKLQERGILVKLSYGGDEWGNLDVYEKTASMARTNADVMARTIEELGLDGIDLVQQQGYGSDNMNADNLSSIQLYFLKYLRSLLPTKLISYTFPGYKSVIDFPFRDVIQYGHQYLNTVNVFRGQMDTIQALNSEYGVPKSKMILGLAIGCNQNPFEDVDLAKAINYTEFVKNEGLAGIMAWSLNRDTDHRTDEYCNELQTGQPDGTFLETIIETLQ